MSQENFTINPYILGRPINEEEKFFGRNKQLKFVRDNLEKQSKIILLHGQRRIGKTSVLYQIKNLLNKLENFQVILLSLQGKSHLTLEELFYKLAQEICDSLEAQDIIKYQQISIPERNQWQSNQLIFKENFLPEVLRCLQGKQLVLLLDEFDALEDQVSSSISNNFFEYLNNNLQHESLYIITVIGRNINDLANLKNIFNQAPYIDIGLLEEAEARKLITEPAKDSLFYPEETIEEILRLTSGHPYLTQAVCYTIFENVIYKFQKSEATPSDVESAVNDAVQYIRAGIEYFYSGLPFLERSLFCAIAEAQEQKQEIWQFLDTHKIDKTQALTSALEELKNLGFIQVHDIKYPQIIVELVRQWLIRYHHFDNEKDKLQKYGGDTWQHSFKPIDNLPEEVYELRYLKFLDLRNASISSFPIKICQLTSLALLLLMGNQLTELPKEIAKLRNLKRLNISGNKLSSLPEEIGELTNLEELSLSDNQLKELPSSFGNLKKLTHLNLSGNTKSCFNSVVILLLPPAPCLLPSLHDSLLI
jgi:Leucine-rich repeat (LRR) protein